MVCENLSSSTSTPSTEFILNAIKELMIHHINPSELSKDIDKARDYKNKFINNITHSAILEKIPNYFELEEKISQKFGEKFTDYLIGNNKVDIKTPPKQALVLKYDGYIEVNNSIYTIVPTEFIENDFLIENFIIDWSVSSEPVPQSVIFDSKTILNPTLTFLYEGNFTVRIRLKSSLYRMGYNKLITLNVKFDVSSSS